MYDSSAAGEAGGDQDVVVLGQPLPGVHALGGKVTFQLVQRTSV